MSESTSRFIAHQDDSEAVIATEFEILFSESNRMALLEGIELHELAEMDAINQMRVVAESLKSEAYIFHSGTTI